MIDVEAKCKLRNSKNAFHRKVQKHTKTANKSADQQAAEASERKTEARERRIQEFYALNIISKRERLAIEANNCNDKTRKERL